MTTGFLASHVSLCKTEVTQGANQHQTLHGISAHREAGLGVQDGGAAGADRPGRASGTQLLQSASPLLRSA